MSTTTLKDSTSLGNISIDDILHDDGDDFQRAILINAKDIYNEKIEAQLIGKGLDMPSTDSHQELTVLCTELYTTTPSDIVLMRSTPYTLEFEVCEDSQLTLNQNKTHGYLKIGSGKKYLLPASREQGYAQVIVPKHSLDGFAFQQMDLLREKVMKSSYFGIEEIPAWQTRAYLQERVTIAHTAHEALLKLFPDTKGYTKKRTLKKTTGWLGKNYTGLDNVCKVQLSFQDMFSYIEGTTHELAQNPTRDKQFLREAGIFGLALGASLATPELTPYTAPLALFSGFDLGFRALNHYITGYQMGVVGTIRSIKQKIENTDPI